MVLLTPVALTIDNELTETVLIKGIHYIRPFDDHSILYVWEENEKDMRTSETGELTWDNIDFNRYKYDTGYISKVLPFSPEMDIEFPI